MKRIDRLTPEMEAQLKPWAEKWIANALRTGPYTQAQIDELELIIHSLYEAADLKRPGRVLICPDPICAAFAWSFAAGIWWLRENEGKHVELFGRALNERDYARAIASACEASGAADGTRATIEATREATFEAVGQPVCTDARGNKDVVSMLLRCANHWWRGSCSGNQQPGWVSYISFFRHVGLEIDYSKWKWFQSAAEYGPRYMHAKFCIVSNYPDVIKQDAEHRPHCEDGPFCRWSTGRALYRWHGTEVPGEWLEDKGGVDPGLALTWENIEQRRCLAEILGWESVLAQLECTTVDKDSDPMIGELFDVDLPDSGRERFLRVLCGTGRNFVLPVPDTVSTALEAQAWIYQVDEIDIKGIEART